MQFMQQIETNEVSAVCGCDIQVLQTLVIHGVDISRDVKMHTSQIESGNYRQIRSIARDHRVKKTV